MFNCISLWLIINKVNQNEEINFGNCSNGYVFNS